MILPTQKRKKKMCVGGIGVGNKAKWIISFRNHPGIASLPKCSTISTILKHTDWETADISYQIKAVFPKYDLTSRHYLRISKSDLLSSLSVS